MQKLYILIVLPKILKKNKLKIFFSLHYRPLLHYPYNQYNH